MIQSIVHAVHVYVNTLHVQQYCRFENNLLSSLSHFSKMQDCRRVLCFLYSTLTKSYLLLRRDTNKKRGATMLVWKVFVEIPAPTNIKQYDSRRRRGGVEAGNEAVVQTMNAISGHVAWIRTKNITIIPSVARALRYIQAKQQAKGFLHPLQ